MPKHACLLRAVNVGGNNRVPMAVFKEILQQLGATNIETYLNSGNAVFDLKASLQKSFAEKVHEAIEEELGLKIGVWLLEEKHLQEILDLNPLINETRDFPARTFVAIGKKAIPTIGMEKVAAFPEEIFAIAKNYLFYFAPSSVPKPKFNNALFEGKLGAELTSRNMNTIFALLEKMRKV